MFCKKCGKELAEDSKFCPGCGIKIEEAQKPILCKNCGKELRKDELFCSVCGQKRDEDSPEQNSNKTDSSISDSGEKTDSESANTKNVIEEVKKFNPLTIASLSFLIIGLFIYHYGILHIIGFILAAVALSQIKKGNGKGKTPTIICMVVSGVLALIFLIESIGFPYLPNLHLPLPFMCG